MTVAPFAYRLYGLTVVSDLALPELTWVALPDGAADVRLATAALPAGLPSEPGLHQVGGGALLNVPDAGRYWVQDGRQLTVEALVGVPERNVRLYLLGSALGLLLHQRGLLPLHASSVVVDGAAIAFVGPSGAGKSTLAAHFLERGCDLLADDVSVVEPRGDSWIVQPGVRRLRLWGETLRALGRDPHCFERAYAGDDQWDKYEVGVGPSASASEAAPLQAIYLLDGGAGGQFEHQSSIEALRVLFGNTYRGQYLASAGLPARHMEQCVALARQVPVFRWRRGWDLGAVERELDQLLAHFQAELRRL